MTRRPGKNKEWYLTGYDIGRLLDRTCPDPSLLPAGNVQTLVEALCAKCNVPCSITGALSSSVVADARALVSATKVADVIVELAQLSGSLAYIDVTTGTLKFANPSESPPTYTDDDSLEHGGDELDLDNYAKGVCVILHRKKVEGDEDEDDDDEDDPPGHFFYGVSVPPLTTESFSSSGISGTRIVPLNLPLTSTTTTSETIQLSDSYKDPSSGATVPSLGTVTISTTITEEYEYGPGHRAGEGISPSSGMPVTTMQGPSYRDYWDIPRAQENPPFYNDNTEHREYKWVETSRTKITVITKAMTGNALNITVRETTTEETKRTFDLDRRLTRETYSRRTQRELISSDYGSDLPDPELYAEYTPKFDETRVTEYNRTGGVLTVTTTTTTNELQEIGGWAPVYEWDKEEGTWVKKQLPEEATGTTAKPFLVRGESFPAWVQHVTVEVDKEYIGENGEVGLKAHTRVSDGGSAYVIARGWTKIIESDPTIVPEGDDENKRKENLAQAAYTAFSSQSANSSAEMSSGAPSDEVVQSEEYEGVTWYWNNVPGGDEWYDPATGGYAQHGGECPHHSGQDCNIADIDVIWDYTDRQCPNKDGRGWSGCPRALAALENQKADEQDVQFAPPVVCHSTQYPASGTYEPVCYRNVYIRDDIPGATKEARDAAARAIGIQLADNLLAVRSARGWVRTITIPLDLTLHISGSIMSVSHDYKSKKSTISYRIDGDVPDFLNSNSPQSMAFYIWDRENNRNTRSVYGTVLEIVSRRRVTVQVGDGEVVCTSNVISLKVGDSVRVSLPAGNRMDGTIEERV
jgi:hypothetical protein